MPDLTPEKLAELRWLAEAATPGPWEAFGAVDGRRGERWLGVTTDMRATEAARAGDVFAAQDCTRQDALFIAAANPAAVLALLDGVDERDRLARLLDEPRRSGCAVEIAGVRIAPCDERGQTADMRERDTLADRLAHMTEARDNARAEVERLTALVERVRELADEWTYKGEFGWDDGSHAYGPDCEGQALDYAAAKLSRALDEEPQP